MADSRHGFPQGQTERGRNAIVTRDHDRIRQWAARQAQPATGEATTSGPATIEVRDHGAGIRFNFPGFGRFRPITWDEKLGKPGGGPMARYDIVSERNR